jgi:16S rRNA (cytidine1402-2'-O)-methyltransferase
MPGNLYLAATPIGNFQDLTLRAHRVLSEVDAVVCEERRIGSTLLSHYKIEKPLLELNEHSEVAQVPELIRRLKEGESLALISDHGTPLLADPGATLVAQALAAGIRVEPIPGASSIVAALVASGLPSVRFRFQSQLPRKKDARGRALRKLKEVNDSVVLLDAPYRLLPLLQSVNDELGEARQVAVACELTMPDERFVRGPVGDVIQEFRRRPFKGEFVLVIGGHTR